MERFPPVLERLTGQISTLLERYTTQQAEIRRIEEEKRMLAQSLEEKNAENKALYNEIASKEKELEDISEKIKMVLGDNNESAGGTAPNF